MTKESLPTALDLEAIKMFGFKVWTYKMGEQVSFMIHLGDRLGFYAAMAKQGPMSSTELADKTGTNERFVREWLLGQAAALLVDRDDEGLFCLTDVQSAVLADEASSIHFAAGSFDGGIEPIIVDRIVESFRSGVGLSYEEQGPGVAAGMARMTAPWSRLGLLDVIIPALAGVTDKLKAGAKVLDIGCGGGVSLTTLAEAFPNSTFVGYDPSRTAIGLALDRAESLNLSNCTFVVDYGHNVQPTADNDLVLTFDCLHDMPRPDLTAEAVRKAIAFDGTWLIKDIRSSGEFTIDQRNPMLALFYAYSVTSCLQSALSEPGGLGLGTLGLHPAKAKELTEQAGFNHLRTHDFNDAANLYYEVTL